MAFELVGHTLSESIDEADTLLFDVALILGLSLPLVQQLESRFYDSPTFSPAEAAALWTELTLLAASLTGAPQAAHLAWAARPPAFRTQIMAGPPDARALIAKIEALARVCRDVAINGGSLRGLSD
jgi:hypothetical protein